MCHHEPASCDLRLRLSSDHIDAMHAVGNIRTDLAKSSAIVVLLAWVARLKIWDGGQPANCSRGLLAQLLLRFAVTRWEFVSLGQSDCLVHIPPFQEFTELIHPSRVLLVLGPRKVCFKQTPFFVVNQPITLDWSELGMFESSLRIGIGFVKR